MGRWHARSRAGVKTRKAKSKDTTRPELEALRKVKLMGPWTRGGRGVTGERTRGSELSVAKEKECSRGGHTGRREAWCKSSVGLMLPFLRDLKK